MKFVEELYRMYEQHFTGDEEDAWMIVRGTMDDYERSHFFQHFKEMSDEEIAEMFSLYVYQQVLTKMAHEGLGLIKNIDDQNGPIIH